jgi:hypothetical protein
MLAAACLLIAVVVYLPALRNGFAYDDAVVITEHAQVTGHAWRAIWASPYHVGRWFAASTGIYRPLTVTSFALDHAAGGGAPAVFHTTSVLWHALATALVALCALRLGFGERGAFAGGLLFAVHPVHVEAVAALAGRSDVIAATFALGAVLFALPGTGRRVRALPAGLCLAAALFAKESALPVAALLPLVPWLGTDAPRARVDSIRLGVAAACAALSYLVVRAAVLGALTLPTGAVTFYENPLFGQPLGTRLLTVLAVLARVAGLLVAPVRLSPDYGYAVVEPATSVAEGLVLAGALALSGCLAAAWLARRSLRVVFLIAWVLATWAIVSNLFVVIGTPLAERQLYLPSIGVCLLAGLLFEQAARRFGTVGPAAVLAVLGLLAVVRTSTWTRAWADDATLFSAAARSAPRSLRVLGNLAVEAADAGRLEDARALLDRAVAIAPRFVPNLINLAGVELDLGNLGAARALAERAVDADPRSAAAHAQLGAVRSAAGDLDGAASSFREALRLDPAFPGAERRLDEVLRRRSG